MNNSLDDIVFHAGKLIVGVIARTVLIIIFGGLLCLVLWVMLLPLFKSCGLEGEAAVKCGGLTAGVLFLAVVGPFLFFWFGKSYALSKAIWGLYDEYKQPLLQACAQKVCDHKQWVASASKFKTGKLFKELPFIVRLMLNRIDISFLSRELQQRPNITPTELVSVLENEIRRRDLVEKPHLRFFWILAMLVIGVFFGLRWWLV